MSCPTCWPGRRAPVAFEYDGPPPFGGKCLIDGTGVRVQHPHPSVKGYPREYRICESGHKLPVGD